MVEAPVMRMMIRRAAPKPHTQKEVARRLAGAVDLSSMPAQPCRTMLLVLISATTAVSSASAQEPAQTLSQLYHTAWTLRDGAPAGIEALAQTADGFLWLGSGTGLFRFDGVRFELFEPPAHQSMPSTNVSALFATPDSGLWVGYRFGGVSLMQRGTIRSYGERDGLPRGSVLSIVEDSAGTTWVGTTSALARLEEGRWRTSRARRGASRGCRERDPGRPPAAALGLGRSGRLHAGGRRDPLRARRTTADLLRRVQDLQLSPGSAGWLDLGLVAGQGLRQLRSARPRVATAARAAASPRIDGDADRPERRAVARPPSQWGHRALLAASSARMRPSDPSHSDSPSACRRTSCRAGSRTVRATCGPARPEGWTGFAAPS